MIEKNDTLMMIAYKAGRVARLLRRGLLSCPYPRLSPGWEQWRQGWLDRDAEEEAWKNWSLH